MENFFSGILGNLILALKVIIFLLPFFLPITLGVLFFGIRMRYIRTRYIAEQDYVLLEIKIPKEIRKSPLAMEVFLTSLYQKGAVTYGDTYLEGKTRPWFSLELVSINGEIRFFIWSQIKYKNMIENQIYAQYPDVEIYEAEDYTSHIKHDSKENMMWGTNFKLSGEDVYPIKTYVDYRLEAKDKEEEKVDPFTAVLEYLGSIKEGEQVWIQILIQAHKKEGLREGRLFKKSEWTKDAEKELEKIKEGMKLDEAHYRIPTEGEKETIAAIERSTDKFAFDCMIRGFYVAKLESFNQISIVGLIGSVRQYNSNSLNGFKLGLYTDHTDNEKDWITIFSWLPGFKKAMEKRKSKLERRFLEAYKMRSFFNPPYRNHRGKAFILTTEEIATIYHFPGEVATTPTLARIPSKKAKPPPNLPV